MLVHRKVDPVYDRHVRDPAARKTFTCQVCERTFPEHWNLVRHMRVHTAEKPFACGSCGKTFADASNLSKHKKIHGAEVRSLLLPKAERMMANAVAHDGERTKLED
jgi:Zinc finger, C2H2 type